MHQADEPPLREAWESQAEAWAAWARTPGHDYFFWRYNLPAFLEIVPAPGSRTVDVGCGEGRVARALLELGHHVVGIDGSPTLARLAATHEPRIAAITGDAAALPLRDGVADLAIAFMSLQDVDDLDRSVAEMGRVLEPGGVLCLAILHPLETAGAVDDDSQPRRFVEHVERDGLRMVFHSVHRPLRAYTDALEGAGLMVEVVREPVPDAELLADHPEMRRERRIPCFLHLLAVKRDLA